MVFKTNLGSSKEQNYSDREIFHAAQIIENEIRNYKLKISDHPYFKAIVVLSGLWLLVSGLLSFNWALSFVVMLFVWLPLITSTAVLKSLFLVFLKHIKIRNGRL